MLREIPFLGLNEPQTTGDKIQQKFFPFDGFLSPRAGLLVEKGIRPFRAFDDLNVSQKVRRKPKIKILSQVRKPVLMDVHLTEKLVKSVAII